MNTIDNFYHVYLPLNHEYMQFSLGKVSESGHVLEVNKRTVFNKYGLTRLPNLEDLILSSSSEKADPLYKQLRCIPNWLDYPKSSDVILLKKLINKIKHIRKVAGVSNNPHNLKPISEENRYKGKIDWTDSNIKAKIKVWKQNGFTIGQIAKKLGIHHSTLSKANKIHNFYKPEEAVA